MRRTNTSYGRALRQSDANSNSHDNGYGYTYTYSYCYSPTHPNAKVSRRLLPRGMDGRRKQVKIVLTCFPRFR